MMPNLYIEETTELEKIEIVKSDLDFVAKRRECAQVWFAAYQLQIRSY